MKSAAFSGSRVTRALASSVLGQLIVVSQTYLLVPLYLVAWGSETYGRWLALTALTSYLSLVDLGGQVYIGNRLAEAFAQQRYTDFIELLRRGFSIFAMLGLVVWALMVAGLLMPITGWTRAEKLVVFFTATNTVVGVPGGVLVSCYAAIGRVTRGSMIGNITRLGSLAMFMAALSLRLGIEGYAAVCWLSGVIGTTIIVVDLRRQAQELFRPRFSAAAMRDAWPLLRASLPYWVFALSGALSLQGVVSILSVATDGATVASYSTHRAAASLILYAGSLLRSALWTELTFLAARSDFDRIRQVVSLAVRSSTWVAAVAGAGICMAAPFGYALWTRSQLTLDVPLLVILAVQAVLASGWSTVAWPLMAANQPRSLTRWSLLNGVLTVGGGYVCLRLGTGLRGLAAWSLAVDLICGLIPFPLNAAAFMQGSVRSFVRDISRAIACAAPFALLALGCLALIDDNRTVLLTFMAGAAILAWPSLWLLYGAADLQRIRRTLLRSARSSPPAH